MNVDADDLRSYYETLTDKALLDLNPEDLTDFARQCYEVELSHRGLKRAIPRTFDGLEPEEPMPASAGMLYSVDHLPWKATAATAAEFENAQEAEQAREVLEQAAIPCALVGKEQD